MKHALAYAFVAATISMSVAQVRESPGGAKPAGAYGHCPVESQTVTLSGMAGNGWDGAGTGSATVFWHVEGTTGDFTAGQRTALITAMQTWAAVVQIDFVEIPIANADQSVDWNFAAGNHCAMEGDECGDPDCPFDGASGVLAHAGFPPGVNSTCVNPMAETWAGNVHFDEAETWELDNAGGAGPFSMTLIACHELGHAIGLTHDVVADSVMLPSFSSNQAFAGLGGTDIAYIQAGYAAGTGSVVTLEDTGVWVNGAWAGTEWGTFALPFDTVSEGVNGVPPFTTAVTVHIAPGNYGETLLITQAMTLQADLGGVVIGE